MTAHVTIQFGQSVRSNLLRYTLRADAILSVTIGAICLADAQPLAIAMELQAGPGIPEERNVKRMDCGALGAALVLSVLFMLAEMRISQLVTFYQRHAFNDADFPRPSGHTLWAGVVLVTMIAPYVMSALFWLTFAFGDLSLPAKH